MSNAYYIQSYVGEGVASSLVMDVQHGLLQEHAALQLYGQKKPPENADNQLWTLVFPVTNQFYIQSAIKDGLVVGRRYHGREPHYRTSAAALHKETNGGREPALDNPAFVPNPVVLLSEEHNRHNRQPHSCH